MKPIDAITSAIRAALGPAINYTGARPDGVTSPWEGWGGPDPFPRRRRPSRWSWNKEGKKHE